MSDSNSERFEVARPGPMSRRELAILGVTWLGAAAYLFVFLDRGWIVGDEGMLGHCAERILQGELPHADFRDPYTGGLSFLHALAFRLFGIQVLTTRAAVYVAALIFLPIFFRLARRVTSPTGAGAMTLLAAVWTLPNYFSAMPSWYTLFLATAALLALVKHIECSPKCGWLWLWTAGALVGLMFLVKPTGLLFFAAVLLFLVYREQENDSGPADGDPWVLPFRIFETVGLSLFLVVLGGFFREDPGPMAYIHFVLPAAALAIYLIARVWRRPSGPGLPRFRWLTGSGLQFVLGFVPAILVFLLPYAQRGELGLWLDPAILYQHERLTFGVWALPRAVTLLFALPLAILFLWPLFRPGVAMRDDEAVQSSSISPLQRLGIALVALVAAAVLALSADPYVYQTVWFTIRPLVPITVVSGVAWLALRGDDTWRRRSPTSNQRQTIFLVLSFTALASISQFPYSRAIYFCYIAPLVALSWLFVADRVARTRATRVVHVALGVFFALFAGLWLNLGWMEAMDVGFRPVDHSERVSLDRARGLLSSPERAHLYEVLVATIRQHSEPGEAIFATPDAPEVYFFSDRRNPTGTFLDFVEEDFGTPERDQRLLRLLETLDIRVVVLRRATVFSPLSPRFVSEVERRFPDSQALGPFTVHWRGHS